MVCRIDNERGHERLEIGRRIIAFIGPEGSGKTENAKLLSAASGKPYLSTSDLLRDIEDNDHGPLGDKVRKMFKDHVYLDGKPLLEIVSSRFSKEDTLNGWILDGGLRTVSETENLEAVLINIGRNFPITVIYLNIPTEMCLGRLKGNPRKRKEDTKEGLGSRLSKFYFQLDERLNIIKSNPNWNLIEIDATPPLATVFGKVCDAVMQFIP